MSNAWSFACLASLDISHVRCRRFCCPLPSRTSLWGRSTSTRTPIAAQCLSRRVEVVYEPGRAPGGCPTSGGLWPRPSPPDEAVSAPFTSPGPLSWAKHLGETTPPSPSPSASFPHAGKWAGPRSADGARRGGRRGGLCPDCVGSPQALPVVVGGGGSRFHAPIPSGDYKPQM